MVLYWAGQPLATWTLELVEYSLYEHSFTTWGGVKTVEVGLASDPGGVGDVDLAVDYVDVAFAGPQIPTVSEWGMIAMTLLLAAAGVFILVRRVPAVRIAK